MSEDLDLAGLAIPDTIPPHVPRTSVKTKPSKPRAPRTRKPKKDARSELLETSNSEAAIGSETVPNKHLSGSEMGAKFATVLRDGIGFAADTIFRGRGAILKEFQSDTLLADLIHADLQKVPILLGNKSQIAICSGVDVINGYQKREVPPPSQPQIQVEQSLFSKIEKNVDSK